MSNGIISTAPVDKFSSTLETGVRVSVQTNTPRPDGAGTAELAWNDRTRGSDRDEARCDGAEWQAAQESLDQPR